MNDFIQTLKTFGIGRVAAIAGVSAGVAIALAVIIVRIGEPKLSVLYSGLTLEETEVVSSRLEQENILFEIKDHDGAMAVFAPQSEKQRLRVLLASDGFVANQGIGYEIFDKSDTFGATTFQQNINRLRALEGELARTISSINGVRSARVHLVLPERELFTRDRKDASASIIVNAPSGIEKQSVRAIINLTASAVPGLKASDVTVLDAAGNLLVAGGSEGEQFGSMIDERTTAAESRVRHIVEDIVGRIVGPDNLRVQVSAELDFNRVTESAEIIDPDSQTVLSSTVVEEISNDNNTLAARGVSVGNALPGTADIDATNPSGSTSSSNRTEETTNYEISRTVRNEVHEQGGIKRLSVAVALNTPSSILTDGTVTPAPRNDQELSRIRTLVASAIGFQANRGDTLEVIEAPFAAPQTPTTTSGASATKASSITALDLMRIAELIALSMIAIALILFVVKPLLEGRLINSKMVPHSSAISNPVHAAIDTITDEFDASANAAKPALLAQSTGSIASQASEIVKSNNDQSVGILKTWIREAS